MTNEPNWLRNLNTWFPVGGTVWSGYRELQAFWMKLVIGSGFSIQ